jgi:enediyne biosynthesis protein E4
MQDKNRRYAPGQNMRSSSPSQITRHCNKFFSTLLIVIFFCSCGKKTPLFKSIDAATSNIYFNNKNEDTDSLNILDYLYFYNGAGVAVGDINGDQLPDVYFTSNMQSSKLYLNKGNFVFEDITDAAGVGAIGGWTTGVTMADVNADGRLDIYVSKVGNHKATTGVLYFASAKNQLFINNGNGSFSEKATAYGLDLQGYNTQAVFFDYDKDGDLDMFQLQHSIHQTDTYGDTSLRNKYSDISGGKLMRNDEGHFTNATAGSGIISSALGYGLGISVADFNNDGWDDMYIGNDFHENDYYYLNQRNGTFKEMNDTIFGHESNFSMGNDAADINNDGWMDIMTLDMLPADEKVLKSSLGDVEFSEYNNLHGSGYHYQYSKNCLQLNTGAGMRFSEIGLYAGVAATDWSWSTLVADYDLDGRNDIFVTNGIKHRLNDLDYIKFIASGEMKDAPSAKTHDRRKIEKMPDGRWHNYIFKGAHDLKFNDKSADWGFAGAGYSSGAAYADLDNDGDPDLVVNNMNEPAGIYKNTTVPDTANNYLTLGFAGSKKNIFGIGVKIFAYSGGTLQYKQLQPVHGFMSCSEPLIHLGLGTTKVVDSLLIIWPDNKIKRMFSIVSNQKLVLNEQDARDSVVNIELFIAKQLGADNPSVFTDITSSINLPFRHKENLSFIDFNRQWFIPHELSTAGPKVAVADVDGDGLDDFYVCGAKLQPGELFVQTKLGTFTSINKVVMGADSVCEEVDAVFFDADGDKDMDLYVASGGNEFYGKVAELDDRLFINDGKGNFAKSTGLPALPENKSCAKPCDFDGDGDIDLFVGSRANSQVYGQTPVSYLLANDGKGNFSIITDITAPGLSSIGMVTGAVFTDVDKDSRMDLVVTGEWMAPVVFKNDGKQLVKQAVSVATNGWWSAIYAADIDGDGDEDLLLGNYGLNSKLKATADAPVLMYLADIDNNQVPDQLLVVNREGKKYPFLGKEDLEKQLPYLKKDYLGYSKMAGKTAEEIFGNRLQKAKLFEASTFASQLWLNSGKGNFATAPLPAPLQWAPLYAFYCADFNKDGKNDLLSGGNFYGVTPYEGRYDAMLPTLSLGIGKGLLSNTFPAEAALRINGEIRDIKPINLSGGRKALLLAINNDQIRFLQY